MMLFNLLIITLFGILVNATANPSGTAQLIKTGEGYLNAWQISMASDVADRILNQSLSDDDKRQAYYYKSLVEYYKGNYAEALEYGRGVEMSHNTVSEKFNPLDYFLKVSEFGLNFKEINTKHFNIRYVHPKDRILISYAEAVLEKAYYEVGLDIDYYPKGRTVVEIYPDLKSFTEASTLSENEIKTTGVVGICKFNRIMILSPRLLPKGFSWFDTLTHEYTHYLVFIKSQNKTPVWIHEGIAKFEEKRWNDKDSNVITPLYETLLALALRDNELVPIEKMHPSFGKLDTAYEAQLAFAQSGSMIEYLADTWGNNAIVNLLDNLRKTGDYKLSIKMVTDREFDSFYDSWVKYLKSKKLSVKIPDVEVRELRFTEGRHSQNGSEDLINIDDIKAREYSRLGDMLRTRGRLKAATYEYEKATHFEPTSPVVLNRLTSVKTDLGQYDDAERLLRPIIELYPDYVDTHLNLGRIYFNKGNFKKAEQELKIALSINPFDPKIHSALISVYENQGILESVEKEQAVLKILLEEEPGNESD
jgi:tetratricopeptide (TPR) repeat protein